MPHPHPSPPLEGEGAPATAEAAAAGAEESQRVRAERVRLLYRLAPASFLTALVAGSALWVVLLDAVPLATLNIWYGALMLVSAARYGLVKLFFRHPREDAETRRWVMWFMLASTLAGVIWGLAGMALYPPHSIHHQVFIAFVLGGVAAGEAISLSSIRLAYLLFLAPALLPVAAQMLARGGEIHLPMGAMVLVFFGILLGMSQRVHATIVDTLRLRFENLGLLAGLESANAKLRAEIAERERAEAETRASRQRLALHVEQTPLAVVQWDAALRVTEWNPAAERIFGVARGEALGRDMVELTEPPAAREEARSRLARVLEHGEAERSTREHRARDGHAVHCEWYHTPLKEGGRVFAVVSLAEDITERIQVERMKREFVSTVSHELRTPLTSIRGSLGLLAGGVGGELPAQAQALVGIADQNSQRLLLLINDLLDMEKIESGMMRLELKTLDLMPVVEQAIAANEGYGQQFGVSLRLAEALPGFRVRADGDRLIQVFGNLLSNAVKFSPKGGEVEVRVTGSGEGARVSVSDHGPGIAEEFRSRIFQKFSQADSSDARQKGGTGLGLAITRALAERMGGSVGFETETGAGSTFFVDLPPPP